MQRTRKLGMVRWVVTVILCTAAIAAGAKQNPVTPPAKPATQTPTAPTPAGKAVSLPSPAKPSAEPAPAPVAPLVGAARFTPEMSFGEAVDILRNSARPPLPVTVLWGDLEQNAGVTRNTPIGIDGISGVPLRVQLELLLVSISAVSRTPVSHTVDHGVVVIGTAKSLRRPWVSRVYYVADLLAPPSMAFMPTIGMPGMMGFPGMQMGGMPMGLSGGGYPGSYGGGYPGSYGGGYPGSYGYPGTGSGTGQGQGLGNLLTGLAR